MILCIDSKGVVDLVNSWSKVGRTRHVDVRYWWVQNMKKEGIIHVKWIETDNTSDLFTKNLAFQYHSQVFVGDD